MKRIIQDRDLIFATGVFLRRDHSVQGGWIVEGFEDDSYFDGELINTEDETGEFFTGEDDEDDKTF